MTEANRNEKFEKHVSRSILASRQNPAVGEAGKTGEWRYVRPVLNEDACLVVKSGKPTCHLCWMYCPENTVSRTIPPEFDYEYCKGCGVCASECPVSAIEMVPEKDAPACEGDTGGEF